MEGKFAPDIAIPLTPFQGTLGVAPPDEFFPPLSSGVASSVSPDPNSGNLDLRELRRSAGRAGADDDQGTRPGTATGLSTPNIDRERRSGRSGFPGDFSERCYRMRCHSAGPR